MGSGSGRERQIAVCGQRDRVRLGKFASARVGRDLAGTAAMLGANEGSLHQWWPLVRWQAATALLPVSVHEGDLDDIAVATMIRLLAALRRARHLEVPFRVLVARSVDYEVRNFRRAHAERAQHEELRAPAEMPEPLVVAAALRPIEDAGVLAEKLEMLGPRDRNIVIEREVLDLPVRLIAARQRMTPDAVRQVCSRALARLRRAAEAAGQRP